LYRKSREKFIKGVVEVLTPDKTNCPTKQCESLSRIWWPLVLSTNYDPMFVNSYMKVQDDTDGDPISVFGRSQVDCHSLLNLLNAPYSSAYWALQGYFGESINNKDLRYEIVVNYRQYRNVTYNNPVFRAVFGEIFRNYSLFFIGSGLTEEYFTGLFGEVLEKLGSNPHTHYALFRKEDLGKKVDHKFLHTKLNTKTIYYEGGYEALHTYIDRLNKAISGENNKFWKLGYASKSFATLKDEVYDKNKARTQELEIVAENMPLPGQDECCIFSAGHSNKRGLLPGYLATFLHDHKTNSTIKRSKGEFEKVTTHLWRLKGSAIYALAARKMDPERERANVRDLRLISVTFAEALKKLTAQYKIIHITLLASGRNRDFPAVFSFVEMIRGYRKFISVSPKKFLLKIHIADPIMLHYVRRNALNVEELLNCEDIRVNIEIHQEEEIERFQGFLLPQTTMKEISDYYDIKPEYWNVSIVPLAFRAQTINVNSKNTLAQLGLIPGSTIRYTRKKTGDDDDDWIYIGK